MVLFSQLRGYGPYRLADVGPNKATIGLFNEEAMCKGALSLEITTLARLIRAGSSIRLRRFLRSIASG